MKKVLCALLLFFAASCGTEKETIVEREREVVTTKPSPTAQKVTYAEMKKLMDKYCGQCHGAEKFMISETELRKKKEVYNQIATNQMPPNEAALGAEDRAIMANFF